MNENAKNRFAKKYIRGIGVEIDALHQPLDVPNNVSVKYIKQPNHEDLAGDYPGVKGSKIIEPNLKNLQELSELEDAKYDFCIANHVLECMSDPEKALHNWIRILIPGGILYLSVSDTSNASDRSRDSKTQEHLNQINQIFDKSPIQESLSCLSSKRQDLFIIVEHEKNITKGAEEFIIILEKCVFIDEILSMLDLMRNSYSIENIKLDIIIPVYNAYDDFIKCLYSVLKYSRNFRLILINDKSTDIRISNLFSKLSNFHLNQLILIENDVNLGFVKTINKGMKYSKRDVILLNSDTIVTNEWADKLQKCAYSNPNIATVTPFTNNGTICSVPRFFEENDVPEGFTIQSFANFIEKVSLKFYPEIPTGIGFCLYIKRSILDDIGFFDEEHFGRGYGEETDFCRRASKKGYKHILCDNLFIFHKGSASFSKESLSLVDKNVKMLLKMYPEHNHLIKDFRINNPIRDLLENIIIRMQTWDITSSKKKILFILHQSEREIEDQVMDLIESLENEFMCYTISVLNNNIVLKQFHNKNNLIYLFPLKESLNLYEFENRNYFEIIEKIVSTFQIDIIHIQHLFGHSLDIVELAKKIEIPMVLSIHDYYMVCPNSNSLDDCNDNYHEINALEKCNSCLRKGLNLPNGFIASWRDNFQRLLDATDRIIMPNRSIYDVMSKYYFIDDSKVVVIEDGNKYREIYGPLINDSFHRRKYADVMSNQELFDSIEKSAYIDYISHDINLFTKFSIIKLFKCLKDNGARYTINKILLYLKIFNRRYLVP